MTGLVDPYNKVLHLKYLENNVWNRLQSKAENPGLLTFWKVLSQQGTIGVFGKNV